MAPLFHSEPFLTGSCLHTSRNSQGAKLVSEYLPQSTTEPLNTLWHSSCPKFFQFASRNFLQANSMQHTATTKQHSSDNIEPCNKPATFLITLFRRTRPALRVPKLPAIEHAAHQPRATSCPVHGQHSEHLPFCEAPLQKFLPGPLGANHGPWSQHCYAARANGFPRHWKTWSPAPFARTVPSANETVTTMRKRHLNQTFCMQIMFTSKHVHRQSLSFPSCQPRTKDATQTKFQLPSSPSLQLKQPSSTHCQRGCYQSSILSRCPTVLHYHAKHKSILAVTKTIQSINFKASLEAPTKRFLCRRCSWMPLAQTCAVKLHAWFGTTRKHNHQRMNATPCPQRQNTDTFTHKPCYTQKLLHTDAFTHRRFCTQTLLRTDPLTHRSFYTQTLLHTEAFTHRRFHTQIFLHTDAFTHRCVF